MKIAALKILVIMTLFFGHMSHAVAEQGWTTYAKVKKIVAVANGGVNVRIEPELTSCTSQSGYGPSYASVYPDHPGLDNIHAIFLAAYMADKSVAIYLSDNTCKVGEVELGG